MANQHLARVLARFEARVHSNKNRFVSVPAPVQRQLRLIRQQDNYLVLYSIRLKGKGRWHHHWSQLTEDNEFAVPASAAHIERGAEVEVKIHRVGRLSEPEGHDRPSGAALLTALAASVDDERTDGSRSVDDYLYGSSQ